MMEVILQDATVRLCVGIALVIVALGWALSKIYKARKEPSIQELQFNHELAMEELRNEEAQKQREHAELMSDTKGSE